VSRRFFRRSGFPGFDFGNKEKWILNDWILAGFLHFLFTYNAHLDNAVQLLRYATASVATQNYKFVTFNVDIRAALLTERPRTK
jgi:hypothetical protein